MPHPAASFTQVCFSHHANELVQKVEHENYTLGSLTGDVKQIGDSYGRLQGARKDLFEYIAKLEVRAGIHRTLVRRF